MPLTKKKEEQLRKMPTIETTISKSVDGKWLIHRTSITHVRPVVYYQAVLDGTKDVVKESDEAPEETISVEELETMHEMPVA